MNGVMLDTNIVSALVMDRGKAVAERVRELRTPASVSIVVATELRYGAARKGSDRLTAAIASVLDALVIEPLLPPIDSVYAALRLSLERAGAPLDANDLWIAAHALSLGRVLVTHDRAFARVPGLLTEDWLS